MRRRRSTRHGARTGGPAVALAAAVGAGFAGCGGDEPTRNEAYCHAVEVNLPALETPAIETEEDIQGALDLYRSLAGEAPLSVQPEWETVVANLETAATVDPEDPESLQRAADTARRSHAAATRIQQVTRDLCRIDIGDPPAATFPVTATTLDTVADSAEG